jgi:hypothetical protein
VAHCPPEMLDDLGVLFAEVRKWPGVVEKRRGVFYVGRAPFLHFHRTADGGRRADVKGASGWRSFDLPRPLSPARRSGFVRALRAQYDGRPAGRLSTRAVRTR